MSNSLASQQRVNALVATMAQGMISVLAVSGMSSFVAYGVAGIASKAGATSAQEELRQVKEKLRKLFFILEKYKSSVISLRNRRAVLMKQYGLIVTPPIVEMRKYPQLSAVERNLKTAEEQLTRLEIKDMNLRKRRNDLERGLGVKSEELPKHVQYTLTKKFVPKTGMY